MQKYELLYIVASNLNDEQKDDVMKKVETIITKYSGVVENVEKIGMKKLAYPINDRTDGFYCLVNFSAEGTAPSEIGKQLNITDGVVRQMIVAK